MKFKHKDKRVWHRKFAWWPMRRQDDSMTIWLESIERRKIGESPFGTIWEYREVSD